MLDLINYITRVKNGDMEFVKDLLVNGFNQDLINDLVNIPATNLNDIQDCFSISIDGKKLSKRINYIKQQAEYDNEIDQCIHMGISLKMAKKYFGLSTKEFSYRRKSNQVDFIDKNLQNFEVNELYSTFNEKIKHGMTEFEALKLTHLSFLNNHNKSVSIKKINEVCNEFD